MWHHLPAAKLDTDLFEGLNFKQLFFKPVFRSSLQNFIKITYAKFRDEEFETETEILRDRDLMISLNTELMLILKDGL